MGSRGGGLGDEVSQKLKLFNICVKIQQTTVAVTRVDILNDITSKILGDMSPLSHRDRRLVANKSSQIDVRCLCRHKPWISPVDVRGLVNCFEVVDEQCFYERVRRERTGTWL